MAPCHGAPDPLPILRGRWRRGLQVSGEDLGVQRDIQVSVQEKLEGLCKARASLLPWQSRMFGPGRGSGLAGVRRSWGTSTRWTSVLLWIEASSPQSSRLRVTQHPMDICLIMGDLVQGILAGGTLLSESEKRIQGVLYSQE